MHDSRTFTNRGKVTMNRRSKVDGKSLDAVKPLDIHIFDIPSNFEIRFPSRKQSMMRNVSFRFVFVSTNDVNVIFLG